MAKYRVGVYLRISISDRENGDCTNSIRVQELELNAYLKKSKDLKNADVKFYIDDGYSGTNFNRPQIQELLQDVKDKKINCVVVKDISRFGRNYIEVGGYLETIFPLLGVRFITVNDGYDSESADETSNFLAAFKSIYADYYSKNLSDKVSASYKRLVKDGRFISNYTAYGYIKSDIDKHILVIDEPAAEVVRWIYTEYIDGKSKGQIARDLNEKGIDSPSKHKKRQGLNVYDGKEITCLWSRKTITDILENETYIGTYTFGKRKRVKVGARQTKNNPEENHSIYKNAFDSIVTDDVFEKAQSLKVKRPIEGRKAPHMYAGFLKCGVCNHNLNYKKGKVRPYVFCNTRTLTEEIPCKETLLYIENLNEIVLQSLVLQIKATVKMERLLQDAPRGTRVEDLQIALRQKNKELERWNKHFKELFKDKLDQKLSVEIFEDESDRYYVKREELNVEIERLETEIDVAKVKLEADNQLINRCMEFEHLTEITKEVLDLFLDEIVVYNNQSLEIKWKFKNWNVL